MIKNLIRTRHNQEIQAKQQFKNISLVVDEREFKNGELAEISRISIPQIQKLVIYPIMERR